MVQLAVKKQNKTKENPIFSMYHTEGLSLNLPSLFGLGLSFPNYFLRAFNQMDAQNKSTDSGNVPSGIPGFVYSSSAPNSPINTLFTISNLHNSKIHKHIYTDAIFPFVQSLNPAFMDVAY